MSELPNLMVDRRFITKYHWTQQHNKQWARFYAQYVSVSDNISGGSGNTMLQVSLDYL